MSTHTIASLKRWSCAGKDLPTVQQIKALHVYDFDNTLFNRPQPNSEIWTGPTIDRLKNKDIFVNGGWWHDPQILGAIGEGIEKEEPRGWKGWWNEEIVSSVRLSMQQKDALVVLLTGRAEYQFAELVSRIVVSRKLDFDMICLKPNIGPNGEGFQGTMNYKQVLLEDLMRTYIEAEEIRVYEDRPKHVKGFQEFFTDFNKSLMPDAIPPPFRKPLTVKVIQVAGIENVLDQVTETAQVQRMINEQNIQLSAKIGQRLQIKRTISYTGYVISRADTHNLLTLFTSNIPETGAKYLANNILIIPGPAPQRILDRVGGIGARVWWEVTGTAVFENKIWACCVKPVPETAKYYTENPVLIIVLALCKNASPTDAGRIQNWQPVPQEKQYVFEAVVGEKVLMSIEDEILEENYRECMFPKDTKC